MLAGPRSRRHSVLKLKSQTEESGNILCDDRPSETPERAVANIRSRTVRSRIINCYVPDE